jgi:ketosteroid isomerase-like protein
MRFTWLAVAVLVVAGAGPTAAAESNGSSEAQRSLLAAERAYSARSAAVGFADATAEVLADNAVKLVDKSPPVVGKAAVVALTRAGWPPAEAKPSLTWEPLAASTSADGTMGFTYGTYTFTVPAKDGSLRSSQGTFTTVWARRAGGGWQVLMDTGHAGLGP